VWGNRDESLVFTVLDKVMMKYMTDEQKQQMMSQKSNFDIYADKGVQAKQDLEAAGFTGIKIWEQPINIMYRNGEEFMAKFGDQRCIPQGKAWGFSDEKI